MFKYANLNQAISFLLALASIYWDWNIIEENSGAYLWSVLINFPFDNSLWEYQDIIFSIEDILLQNHIYNKLFLTKKQNFIWNIYDFDLLETFWKAILNTNLKDFFQINEEVQALYKKELPKLVQQLDTDLRIHLDRFKLTEIENIKKY